MIDFNDIKSTILLFALNCFQSNRNLTLRQLCKKLWKNTSISRIWLPNCTKSKLAGKPLFILILAKMDPQILNYWHDMHLYSSKFPKIDIFHCWFHYVQDESEFRKSFCVMSAFRPRGVFWKVEMTTGNEKVSDSFNWIQQVFANLSWRIKDFQIVHNFFSKVSK